MKKYLFILTLFITSACQSGNEPTTRDILESELPKVWQKVRTIHLWEGESFKEFEVKRTPIDNEVCAFLNISEQEVPQTSFIFDSEGNKTSYFLALEKSAIGVDSLTFLQKDKIGNKEYNRLTINIKDVLNEIASVHLISLYTERINKKGDYEITQTGGVAKSGIDRWIFKYLNPEKSFNGEMIIEKNTSLILIKIVPLFFYIFFLSKQSLY